MRLPILWWVLGLFAAALLVGGLLALRSSKTPAPVEPPPPAVEYPIEKSIGRSVEGRNILAYTYGSGPEHLVFVGGIHGGYEWNTVILAQQLKKYLDQNPAAVPSALTVTVIPDLNPDAIFKALGKTQELSVEDVPDRDLSPERFNANAVDLNRNFDCKWEPTGTWRSKTVSGGSEVFSEPESKAMRDFALSAKPAGMVFWHSQAGEVYASQCENGILPATIDMMNAYAQAAGYAPVEEFTHYEVHGAAEDWLASIGVPTISVELKTHESVEWEENLAGVQALIRHFSK